MINDVSSKTTDVSKPTHVAVSINSLSVNILKFVAIISVINCILFVVNYYFKITYNFNFDIPSTWNNLELMFVYEGAGLIVFGPLAMNMRESKSKIIEARSDSDVSKKNSSKNANFFEKDLIVRKENIKGIIGLFSGIVLLVLSVVIGFIVPN